jgi:DNA recombination protein RmuC
MELFYLLAGLLLGAVISWLITFYRFQAYKGIPESELSVRYVLKEIHQQVQQQSDIYREDLLEKEMEIRKISQELAARQQEILHLDQRLNTQLEEMSTLQSRFQLEFENVANRLLEEKSRKFTLQNQEQLGILLQPLRDKIREFEQGIEQKYIQETKDRSALRTEIEQLHHLNQQLSKDAHNLVRALKGDSKVQGNWGESRLETLLEKAGLVKEVHFKTQATYLDTDGQMKRPDFIILLPGNKHLVVDAKVSLTAFELYSSEENDSLRPRHLKAHVDSLRNHIRDLSAKNYQHLYQINTPDYLILFVPLEPAFALAQQHDDKLFDFALDKNIVIVTPSTLLATMRTVSYIWQQEKQKNNVLEIARQSGLLYDKFCSFIENLKEIGTRLDHAKNAYDDALNKLSDSKRFGDTIIGRAEKIRELGAKASKQLPKDLLE